ncbi:PLP-dependent transferase [Polychaeton citri CBS 116435]|uniref:PLP-dependent transferase n=1 Tax=Polychaeton citri CBS 116435 TaxID=1314669 RepID=A0A9P4PZY5_9PEZI|nr:PLP-dependent transferase [Polychaeton citri CBS 116435]
MSALTSPNSPRFPDRYARSSVGDVSSTSESENDRDYTTDFTTPDDTPEDSQPDDVDDFRDREYPQLKGKTYMDHGGTTLYAKSLMEEFSHDMISNLYGNPHSASSPSALAGHRVDAIREKTLRFFNANPAEFDLVFTANATAAIKLVIDCLKDYAAATNTPVWYGYHKDAHTSLVGMREVTKMHRCFTSDEEVDLWINSGGLGGPRARQLGLFAYPGQSNMTGRRLPLSWPGRIRRGFHKAPTYTLLDAAALASTAPLDLSDASTAPDFVALSFYKIFGFPNIGALLVRKESSHVLESRKYFGGGTVEMVITIHDTWHAKKDTSLHDRLEDGTLPFHSIFALDHAINVHRRLYGPNPMKFISHHTAQLGKKLYDGLSSLKHNNGLPVVRIYKDDNAIYGDPTLQGATVAFNVQRSDGSLVGFEEVEQAADDRCIYVRSGSLCNPGGVATYLEWTPAEMRAAFAGGHRCSSPVQLFLGKPTGVVRVSLGAMSTNSDIRTFLHFIREVYLDAKGAPKEMKAVPTSYGMLSPNTVPASASAPGSPIGPGPLYFPDPPSLPSSQHGLPPRSPSSDRAQPPPFIPSEYVRKPWADQMRKDHNATITETRVRELEDARTSNTTPSVKARKFGRSVVNLLRTKSHYADSATTRHETPPPWQPGIPYQQQTPT